MNLRIIKHDHHRNGISGVPFSVVIFEHREHSRSRNKEIMFAVLFDEQPGSCAVFDFGLLKDENVTFGQNSWRGDHFETELRRLLKEIEP